MKTLLSFLCLVFTLSLHAQLVAPPVYTVDRNVHALCAKGDTLIVGGDFLHAGKYSGGMALFTTASDQADPIFPKTEEEINSSTPDGAGGFYIFTSASYIRHLFSNKTIDTAFHIQVNSAGGNIREFKILYHNGVLYVGGYLFRAYYGATAGELIAFNVSTKQRLTTIPIVNAQVKNLRISGGTLYIIGSFDTVGGIHRKGIAAINTASERLKPWYPSFTNCTSSNTSFTDVVFYGNQAIIGGDFPDSCIGGIARYKTVVVDTATGTFNRFIFPSFGLFGGGLSNIYWAASVQKMAIEGNRLFVYTGGTFDTRLTAINLAANDAVIWARYFNMIAAANDIIATGGAVFLGGYAVEDIYKTDSTNDNAANIEQKLLNIVKLDGTTGTVQNWNPAPVGLIYNEVKTLCLNGTDILMGGSFTHVNGLSRPGVFMMKSSTQTILPFAISGAIFESSNAIKLLGDTLILAGDWSYPTTTIKRTIRTFKINTSQEISPATPYLGTAQAVEADGPNIYIAGNITDTSGGITKAKLFAINRQTGQVRNWAPMPNGDVYALHIADGRLYAAGSFTMISGQSRQNIAAYDLATLNLLPWTTPYAGPWYAIKSDDSLIYLGGLGDLVDTSYIDHVAGFRKTDGSPARIVPRQAQPGIVHDILIKDKTLITGTESTSSIDSCGAPFIYQGGARLQRKNDVCMTLDEGFGNIFALALSGNDVYYGGKFTRTNSQLRGTSLGRIQFPSGYFNQSTGVAQSRAVQPVLLYPNPANEFIVVDLGTLIHGNVLFEVIDQTGRILISKNASEISKEVINIKPLVQGIYFLRVTSIDKRNTKRFLKK